MKSDLKYRSWVPERLDSQDRQISVWWEKSAQKIGVPDFIPKAEQADNEPEKLRSVPNTPPEASPEAIPCVPSPVSPPEPTIEKSEEKFIQAESAKILEKLSELGLLLDVIRHQAAEIMTECVMAVTGKLLRKKVQVDSAWLLNNLRRCLSNIPPNGKIVVRISPIDMEALKKLPEAQAWMQRSSGELEFSADVNLQPGDCIVESSRARIDARLQSQLDGIRPVIEEIIALALSEGSEK